MSQALRSTLEQRLGWTIRSLQPVTGGDLNDAYRVETSDGPRFVKTSADAEPGAYRAEAAGLLWLSQPDGGVTVPRVAGLHDPPEATDEPRLLALEWVEARPLTAPAAETLGRALAATHAAGAPAFGATPQLANGAGIALGPETANDPSLFGTVQLPNDPAPDFCRFFAEQRIRPLVTLARRRGALDESDEDLFEGLIERLPDRCGPAEPPARIHGDLWAGNVIGGPGDGGWVFDPAAHGSHRELDLAALQLFGSPPESFFAAYEEVFPLAEGAHERVELMQLPLVLLHAVLFAGGYVQAARRIAYRYL